MTVLDPLRILRVFAEHDVRHVLIGQTAAVLHGHPETTMDIDVLPALDVDNAERLAGALRALGAHRVGELTSPDERDFIGLRQVMSYDTEAGRIDVLPAASGLGAFGDLASRAEQVDLGGYWVLVASLDDVIASKEAAGRPKDLRRLDSLREFRRRCDGSRNGPP